MSDNEKEQIFLLKEILKWMRFSGMKEVKEALKTALDTDIKVLIYDLSNGERGSVEIAKIAKVNDKTIRRYWLSWGRLGLMESIRVRGGDRYKKIFEVEDFGFDVPDYKKEKSSNKEYENAENLEQSE